MSSTAPEMKQMHEGEVKTGEMKRAHRAITRYPQGTLQGATQRVLRGYSDRPGGAENGIWSGFFTYLHLPFQSSVCGAHVQYAHTVENNTER